MPKTPVALELQITKAYLGEDTYLAYLGALYEEVLKSDTYAKGAGTTVARVVDGTAFGYANTAISGVANIGNDTNWTGLQTQHYEARWWRDASLQYFASVSKHTIPVTYAAPLHDLAFYKNLVAKCPSDATKPRCPDVYTGNPSPAVLK